MLTTTQTNIIIINSNNSNNNSDTKTTPTGLRADAHENIDGQKNGVNKEPMDNTLIIKRIWYPV